MSLFIERYYMNLGVSWKCFDGCEQRDCTEEEALKQVKT